MRKAWPDVVGSKMEGARDLVSHNHVQEGKLSFTLRFFWLE